MLRSTILLSFFSMCMVIQAQQLDPALLVQVHGTVVDADNDQLLQATIYVMAPDSVNELAVTDTNTEGHYGLVLQRGGVYILKVELEGYRVYVQRSDLSTADVKGLELNIRMKRSVAVPIDQ